MQAAHSDDNGANFVQSLITSWFSASTNLCFLALTVTLSGMFYSAVFLLFLRPPPFLSNQGWEGDCHSETDRASACVETAWRLRKQQIPVSSLCVQKSLTVRPSTACLLKKISQNGMILSPRPLPVWSYCFNFYLSPAIFVISLIYIKQAHPWKYFSTVLKLLLE